MPITVEIVSPEEKLLSRDVDMVILPGSEGDIAAQPEHAPVMLLMRGGVVSLYENDEVVERFFVTGGFADITPTHCIILADEAHPVEKLSAQEGQERLEQAQAALAQAGTDDFAALEPLREAVQSAEAWVSVAGKGGR